MNSAANITSTSSAASANSRPAPGGSPLVHEVPVVATGARPGENSGKRELFTETTSTALVFPNGGVIRLSVPVAPGQLLFLTNKQTRQEVVAQVTRRRDNPATGYYAELVFTEPSPGFWGVEFPEAPAASPADSPQPHVAELLPVLDSAPPPAPSLADVQQLTKEVETLLAQPQSLQAQNATAKAPTRPAPAPEVPTPSAPLPSSNNIEQASAPASPAPGPASAPVQPLPRLSLSSVVTPAATPPRTAPASSPEFSEDDLLSKPALNFEQAKAAEIYKRGSASGDRLGSLRLALLAAVSLFAVTVAAWNMHWLPWLSPRTNPSDLRSSSARPAAQPASPARPTAPVAPQKPDAHLDSSIPAQAANLSFSQPVNTSPSQPGAATPVPGKPSKPAADAATSPATEESVSSADRAADSPRHKDSAPVTPVSKRSPMVSSAPAESASTSPADDASIVPPRLILSVRAIAPGDALRDFVTGNVTLDALIDTTGHVASMKILSGPPTFYTAAMDALKQYRYEPARQNGKPVATHITVTVPFWFEP